MAEEIDRDLILSVKTEEVVLLIEVTLSIEVMLLIELIIVPVVLL